MDASEVIVIPFSSGIVHIRAEILTRLAADAAAGFVRSAWGGVEFGGLLVGKKSPASLHVNTFTPLACEHEYGPAFHLSEADHRALHASLTAAAADGNEVLGWYRTTSRELSLTQDDEDLVKHHFAQPWQITLLLHRGKKSAAKFGLFGNSVGGKGFSLIHSFGMDDIPSLLAPPEPTPASPPREPELRPSHVDRPPSREGPEYADSHPMGGVPVGRVYVELSGNDLAKRQDTPEQHTTLSSSDGIHEHDREHDRSEHQHPTQNPRSGSLDLFGLREDPFLSAQDPSKYFPSSQHREALAALEYGIESRKGLVVITGETGVGKTMLLHCLADRLKADGTEFARIFNPRISTIELFETLAYELRFSRAGGKMSTLFALHERAVSCAERGKTLAVLIDDAHSLDLSVLEEIEALTNIEGRRGKLVQIVLAGRPQLNDKLDQSNLRGLRQRIALRATLGTFSQDESAAYMRARFSASGGSIANVMSPEVMVDIHRTSLGVPRLINIICTLALENAAREGQAVVTLAILVKALDQLNQPSAPVTEPPIS